MSTVTIGYGEIYEDSASVFMARVVGADGATVNQASISSIAYEVWDKDSTATAAVSTATVAVTDVIYTSLQTSEPWTYDNTGYNFKHDMGTSAMTTAGHRYLVQYDITPASGGSYPLQFEVVTRKRY